MQTHFYKKDDKLFFALVSKPLPGTGEQFYAYDNVATEQHIKEYKAAYEIYQKADLVAKKKEEVQQEVEEVNKEAAGLIKKVKGVLSINKSKKK